MRLKKIAVTVSVTPYANAAARAVAGADVRREQPRRERDERDAEQEEDVDEEERPVDAAQLPQDGVVVDPDDPDRQEADGVADVRRPQPRELVREAVLAELRHLDVEDEQRRGDREDAVGERLEPRGAQRIASRPTVRPGGSSRSFSSASSTPGT